MQHVTLQQLASNRLLGLRQRLVTGLNVLEQRRFARALPDEIRKQLANAIEGQELDRQPIHRSAPHIGQERRPVPGKGLSNRSGNADTFFAPPGIPSRSGAAVHDPRLAGVRRLQVARSSRPRDSRNRPPACMLRRHRGHPSGAACGRDVPSVRLSSPLLTRALRFAEPVARGRLAAVLTVLLHLALQLLAAMLENLNVIQQGGDE